MRETINIDGETYSVDLNDPLDVSIPLRFNGPQPNAYGVAPARSTPCSAGDLVGDTRQGGSCNFEEYTFIPHCNGTHTECVGHITNERISLRDTLRDVFVAALLISIDPISSGETVETYSDAAEPADRLITLAALKSALNGARPGSALIIRTLANDERKLTRQYLDPVPGYFTSEAMDHIVALGVKHLLVDLPSIDRLFDDGHLLNHRIFWNVQQGSFEATSTSRRNCTITEMIYVPNRLEDGRYLLNLQIAPFASDASPSRPVLFRVT